MHEQIIYQRHSQAHSLHYMTNHEDFTRYRQNLHNKTSLSSLELTRDRQDHTVSYLSSIQLSGTFDDAGSSCSSNDGVLPYDYSAKNPWLQSNKTHLFLTENIGFVIIFLERFSIAQRIKHMLHISPLIQCVNDSNIVYGIHGIMVIQTVYVHHST